MTNEQVGDVSSIQSTRLFQSNYLADDDRRALSAIAAKARSWPAHSDIVARCAPVGSIYVLTHGWACRYKITREGARQITGLVVPGDMCNLDSFLLPAIDFGVRTLTAATAVPVPRDQLQALAEKRPGIARALTWFAIVENAMLSEGAVSLGRQSAQERLAHLFCELANRLGNRSENKAEFDFPLTQEQIADTLGLTSVHVNRMVQRLRAEELITIRNHHVTIPDMARLAALGGFDKAYLHLAPSS
jgi:CRP-like cAMP-binding protein